MKYLSIYSDIINDIGAEFSFPKRSADKSIIGDENINIRNRLGNLYYKYII